MLARLDRTGLSRALDNLSQVFPEAMQHGGAADRGRQLTGQHPAAQCTRCHTVAPEEAAAVGPNLARVGSELSRQQLLEALVNPGARIAPGFGTVSLALKNGQRVEGLLREETAESLVVETTSGRQRVPAADIAQRTNGPSAMPPMGSLLSPREIRDVVEYLSTLK